MNKALADQTIALSSAQSGGHDEYTGILLEGKGDLSAAVILFHGRKQHPDGDVVGPLRRSLNRIGYTTLSIQAPVPKLSDEFGDYVEDINGKNYVFPEAYARVRTAMKYLKQQLGTQQIVLLGHSMGARMHSAFLAQGERTELPVRALIALSNGVNGIPPLNAASSLKRICLPVLDVSGEGDPNVAKSLDVRKTAYCGGRGKDFTGIVINGAVPHDFAGFDQDVERCVHAWIATVAPAYASRSQ